MDIKRYLRFRTYFRFAKRIATVTFESVRDTARLRKQFPPLQHFGDLARKHYQKLLPFYDSYISEVSNENFAISLELSAFLMVMCDLLKPIRILDLGSGFSSFVFRYYCINSNHNITVWSVDDSDRWLENTRAYLIAHNLPIENLETWDSFAQTEISAFDLILYDLGSMVMREKALRKVLTYPHSGGMIILDDAHKPGYVVYAKRVLKESGYTYYSLKSYTEDNLGRYSMLGIC